MRRERKAAHKRPPWPERVLRDDLGPLLHNPSAARRDPWTASLIGIVVALALAAGLLGVLRAFGAADDETSGSPPRPDATVSAQPSSPAASPTDANRQAVESCHQLWLLQQQVLTAARPAMTQWATHIAAMNQLVAGKITLAQATAFWNSTRVGAARNIQAHTVADERFRSSTGPLCPAATSRPADASPALQACLDAVEAGGTTVESARTTMTTWSHHVHDMERLRNGTLSPTRALQLWLQTWKQGDRELRAYRLHDRNAERLSCQP